MESDIGDRVKTISGTVHKRHAVEVRSSLLRGSEDSERFPSGNAWSEISFIPVTSDCLTKGTSSFDHGASGEWSYISILASDDDYGQALRLVDDLTSGSEVHLACLVELVQGALSPHPVHSVRRHCLGDSK